MNKKLIFVTVCVLILFQACASPSPAPIIEPTKTATLVPPTSTPPPTVAPTSTTPTPIPLAWTQISDGQDFEHDTVTAFATDKTDSNIIYAGMKNSGVYKTVDGGLSWQPVNQGLVSKKVESLLIDSQNPLILYAGTIGGIFKTEDGGKNWSRVSEGTYLLMDWQDNSHLYARDENTIYETMDQGKSWVTAYTLKKECPDEIHSWAIHPADGDLLFIGGGETCAGVYQSSDKGQTWALIGLKDRSNLDALVIGLNEQEEYVIFANFPSTAGYQWKTYGWYASHDGGVSWSKWDYCASMVVNTGNPSDLNCAPYITSIIYSSVHIDYPNGVERTIIGGTDVGNEGNEYVAIFISMDGGSVWEERSSGIGSARTELQIDSVDKARIYLATYYAGRWTTNGCTLYRSLDGGKNWVSIKAGGDWCGPAFAATHAFYMIEMGSLQSSQDGGGNWLWGYQKVGEHDNQKSRAEGAKRVANRLLVEAQSVSANPYVDGLIYAVGDTILFSTSGSVPREPTTGSEGSWDGRLFYTDQSKVIFAVGRYHQKYSTDNGMTWQACGEDVTTAQSDSRLALDLQGNKLYLATPGQGVLVSTDKCGSWQASNDGLSNLFVNTVAMDPNNSDIVYAGTDGGAYVSFDGGANWGQVNDGLIGSTIVYSIVVDSESNVYAATPYGVFKLEGR